MGACNLSLFPVQSDMWELLFHSNQHGQSFNTFMGKVGKLSFHTSPNAIIVLNHNHRQKQLLLLLPCDDSMLTACNTVPRHMFIKSMFPGCMPSHAM